MFAGCAVESGWFSLTSGGGVGAGRSLGWVAGLAGPVTAGAGDRRVGAPLGLGLDVRHQEVGAVLDPQPDLKPQLILEEASRNTLENLKQARLFLTQQNSALQVDLLSNRYHLYRCQALAQGLGFNVTLVAAEKHFDGRWANCYKIFMEAFFSHWYHTGARVSRWLNNKRMLAKIH